jgi:alpha-D-xyloside xylohydrolase
LQLQSFQQRGLKKKLRVNADPAMDSGDSHAPVPFYVTTAGYGVLIDTARYPTFYCGTKISNPNRPGKRLQDDAGQASKFRSRDQMLIEIPEAGGVDVYVFGGPSMRLAVQRYNLFSGGGAMPPRWGLGFWYRCEANFNQPSVLKMAAELRERRIPCDVLGLEPHWQSHAYSCSFVWDKRFPQPADLVQKLQQQHYRLNLWEHAFTHPSSPIYQPLLPHSGDFEVWGGLVPDFLSPDARQIFADFHDKEHVSLGVASYKLDECDNSDFTGNWSFPELSRFPSGADGEQMHSLFGLHYQETIQRIYQKRNLRTFGLVRSSQAFAAPYPYVLYSDLYDHKQFIHGVAQASFSGLLWTPEVREARDPEDLLRRMETVIFSPMAIVNAWYLKNPPWKQVNRAANNAGQFAPGWEALESQCRELVELRMKFIPYLHAAFARYCQEGLPPFRALVLDYPNDAETRTVDDEYLVGDNLVVAPVVAGTNERSVYLPEGDWFDFWSGQLYHGRQHVQVTVPLTEVPLFVKSGTLLPLAQPTLHTDDPDSLKLNVLVYGDGSNRCTLFEDDGGFAPHLTEARLVWNQASATGQLVRASKGNEAAYSVSSWRVVH